MTRSSKSARSTETATRSPSAESRRRRFDGLRRAAGYRAVQDAAGASGFPAARQTIYAYERGGLTPSLQQFLEITEFYALHPAKGDGAKPEDDLRAQAVAAVTRALTLRAYHVRQAHELMDRLQPPLTVSHRHRRRGS